MLYLFFKVSCIVNIVFSLFFGAFLFNRKKRELLNYTLFSINNCIWSAFHLAIGMLASIESLKKFVPITTLSIFLIPFFFLNFCYELIQKKMPLPFMIYNGLVSVILIFFSFTTLMISEFDAILFFKWWPIAGPVFYLGIAYFCINVVLGFYLLFTKLEKSKKNNLILWGLFIGFLGGTTNFFPYLKIPIFPYGNILISVGVIIITHGIIKHRLLDISVVVSDTVSRILTFGFLVSTYILGYLLFKNYIPLLPAFIYVILNLLFFIFSCELYPIIENKIQEYPHRLFIRNYYDVQTAFEEIRDSLQKCLNFKECILVIKNFMYTHLQVLRVNAFFIENYDSTKTPGDKLILRNYGARSDKMQVSLPLSHPIVKMVFEYKTVLTKDDVSFTEKNSFYKLNASVVIPVFAENQLLALFSLSESKAGDFTSNDIAFFRLLSSHLGLVLDTMRAHTMIKVAFQKAQKTASMLSLMNQYQHDIKACWVAVDGQIEKTIKTKNDLSDLASLLLSDAAQAIHSEKKKDIEKDWKIEYNRLVDVFKTQQDRAFSLAVTMGKILSGKDYHNYQPISLQKVIHSSIELFPVIKECIQQKFETDPLVVQADLIDLQILIINILKNSHEAFLANTPGDSFLIQIEATIVDAEIRMTISDNAGGMPQELLDLVKNNTSITTKAEGSGIGLLTVKRIMEEHQGSVDIQLNERRGTTFILTFPFVMTSNDMNTETFT